VNRIALAALVVAGCTVDVDLGARQAAIDASAAPDACVCSAADGCNTCPTAACDPQNGNLCECNDTAECPSNFYCVPDQNSDPNARYCQPPQDCNTDPDGNLDCTNTGCDPNQADCNAAPDCNANNSCANNGDACCPTDGKCYPADCVGCCTNANN